MNPFGHTVTGEDGHLLLTLTGDVDFAAHAELAEQIRTLVEAGNAVVVDCSGVTFLDSMGLRALVEGRRLAGRAGLPFELAAPSRPVLRVMELSGTAELFTIRDPRTEEPTP